MRKQQRGMTALGLLILVVVCGFYAYAVLQLVPVYLENMRVVAVLKQVKSDLDGQNASLVDIRKAIDNRANVEDLRNMNWRKDFVISRSGNGYYVTTEYDRIMPLVANVSMLAEFDYEVEIIR